MRVRMALKWVLMGLLLAALLTGCRDDRAWTSADSWYNPPPANTYPLSGWQPLDFSQVVQVSASQQAAAERLLQNAAILEITSQEAAALYGKPFPSTSNSILYLVRAVYLNPGGFSVYIKDKQLLISHASLGHGPVSMKRQALIVQLKEKPADVFVTCSMAE